MNILVCSSKAFFNYLIVMLASLYENNQSHKVNVYVMHSELMPSDIELLNAQAEKYGNEVISVEVSIESLEALPTRQQWPLVLYYRLMAADMLPDSVDKVLSLDIDIIVRKSLHSLFEIDLDQFYIAAAEDAFINTVNYKKGIRLPLQQVYFNAGVFLLNLQKLRSDGIGLRTFLQAAQDQNFQLTVPDQDLLNIVLGSKLKLIEGTSYNCSPILLEQMYGREMANSDSFASIVHYLNPDFKPWATHVGNIGSELEDLWWSYAKRTPFYEELRDNFDQDITRTLVKENITLKLYFRIAHKWMQVENRPQKLERYFIGQGYRNIAIYGLSALSEVLCRDLEGTQVNIKYLIDSYAKGYAHGYEVKNGTHFEDVNVIVVAACAHFRDIRSRLDDTCPVISLDEVITEICKF